MICLLYRLSRLLNTYLFAFTLLFAIIGGAISISYGILIRDEISIQVYSTYLNKSIQDLTFNVGISIGTIVIIISLFGVLFITPFHKRWMFFIYSPIVLLCFAVLMGLAVFLKQSGKLGAELVSDYCNNSFERWTKYKYGEFVVQLDNTYTELSKNILCSKNCACVKINYNLWLLSENVLDDYNAYLEYSKKYFNGAAQNVLNCMDIINKSGTYDTKVIDYLTYLEKTYQCAGVCEALYFYPFTDVQVGPPAESCLNYIIEEFEGGAYKKYSNAFFSAGTVVFLSWFVSFGLCFRKSPLWNSKVTVNG